MDMIKVYLIGLDGISQHFSGTLPMETVESHAVIRRDGKLYCYESFHNDGVYYREAEMPYEVTEW